jgi:hypothetical protein
VGQFYLSQGQGPWEGPFQRSLVVAFLLEDGGLQLFKRTSPTSDRRRKEKRATQNMNRNIARERKQIPFLTRKTPNKSEASKAI